MAVVLEVTAATHTQELNTAASGESSGTTPVVEDNKAVSAAKLCVDYLQDVESAVTILVTAQQWTLAMDYAGRFQRRDLYDEVNRVFLVSFCIYLMNCVPFFLFVLFQNLFK